MNLDKMILKFILKKNGMQQQAEKSTKQEELRRRLFQPHVKVYHKASIIKTLWYLHMIHDMTV